MPPSAVYSGGVAVVAPIGGSPALVPIDVLVRDVLSGAAYTPCPEYLLALAAAFRSVDQENAQLRADVRATSHIGAGRVRRLKRDARVMVLDIMFNVKQYQAAVGANGDFGAKEEALEDAMRRLEHWVRSD